jgi:hypothetical protein
VDASPVSAAIATALPDANVAAMAMTATLFLNLETIAIPFYLAGG